MEPYSRLRSNGRFKALIVLKNVRKHTPQLENTAATRV